MENNQSAQFNPDHGEWELSFVYNYTQSVLASYGIPEEYQNLTAIIESYYYDKTAERDVTLPNDWEFSGMRDGHYLDGFLNGNETGHCKDKMVRLIASLFYVITSRPITYTIGDTRVCFHTQATTPIHMKLFTKLVDVYNPTKRPIRVLRSACITHARTREFLEINGKTTTSCWHCAKYAVITGLTVPGYLCSHTRRRQYQLACSKVIIAKNEPDNIKGMLVALYNNTQAHFESMYRDNIEYDHMVSMCKMYSQMTRPGVNIKRRWCISNAGSEPLFFGTLLGKLAYHYTYVRHMRFMPQTAVDVFNQFGAFLSRHYNFYFKQDVGQHLLLPNRLCRALKKLKLPVVRLAEIPEDAHQQVLDVLTGSALFDIDEAKLQELYMIYTI